MMRFAAVLVLLAIVCLGAWAPSSAQADRKPAVVQVSESDDIDISVEVATEDTADESAEETAEEEEEKAGESSSDKAESNGKAANEAESEDDEKPSEAKAEKKEKDSAEPKTEAKSKEKAAHEDDAKVAKPAKPAAKKRKTHKVDTKRMKIDVPLDGMFVAGKMTEVPFRPEVWTDYEIVEVASLGAKVRKGETLFKFDDKKIKESIADMELDQRLNELSIMKSEEEMPRLEKTLAMDLTAAERADKEAHEDFDRYKQIDRPMYLKSAEFMAKYYGFMLDYEKDELEQLVKMYEADDLTEDTEELVLKRQRNTVEAAEFSLEGAKLNRDEMLNVRIPRYDIEIKEGLDRTAMALARAKLASQIDLNRARYELQQRKDARAKSLERYSKMLVDRGLMEIKSPADGIVYYGKNTNGRWNETAALINRYEPKNNVTASPALMTIVEPRPLLVTATFEEAKRPEIAVGQKVKVSPPAEGAERISGKVKDISPLEVAPGKFEINFEIEGDQVPDWVIAGMGCKLKINTYDKADALTVPKAAVHTDKEDEDVQYVWVVVDPDDADAKPERRTVKLGRRSGDDVEITKGLKKGDIISLDDEDKSDKEKMADKKTAGE